MGSRTLARKYGLDVIDLASHLGYSTIDLLGFSMGGHITQAILSSEEYVKVDEKDGLVVVKGKTGEVKIRKAILTATMTKLPRGDVDFNALNAEAAKIPDKAQRNDFITTNMMRLQYHEDALSSTSSPIYAKFEKRLEVAKSTNRPAWIIGLQFMAIQSGDLRQQLHRIPQSVQVMVIHGKRDRMVLWKESEVTMEKIGHAKRLSTPSGEFGHFWYDYFDIQFWVQSIAAFLDEGKVGSADAGKAKL